MLRARTVLVTLVAVGLGVVVALAAGGFKPAAEVIVPAVAARPAQPPGGAGQIAVGMSGCLAAACHGGPAEKVLKGDPGADAWQCSGSAWAAADPHTAAYSLLTDRPRRAVTMSAGAIMAKYAPGKKATDDARCVACHTNPALAAPNAMADAHSVALREQGVSCEACHGNAGAWVQPHTAWTGDRTARYAGVGLAPLYDLGERALNCAGCHVGAPAGGGLPVRDMNHDMIAAGHPRLNFDFAEYQRRMPKHWMEKDRTKSDTPKREVSELKVWFLGRTAHAEAACRLLADRAARSEAGDRRTPWPELAEFNCASCHHNLRVPGADDKYGDWRASDEYLTGRAPGVPPWQTIWPLTHAPGLTIPPRRGSKLRDVVQVMEGGGRTARHTPAADVRRATEPAVTDLEGSRRSFVRTPDAELGNYVREYFPPGGPRLPEWDSATQLFFGLAALEYSRGTPSADTVASYQAGVAAFRKHDWAAVETAFGRIRPK